MYVCDQLFFPHRTEVRYRKDFCVQSSNHVKCMFLASRSAFTENFEQSPDYYLMCGPCCCFPISHSFGVREDAKHEVTYTEVIMRFRTKEPLDFNL